MSTRLEATMLEAIAKKRRIWNRSGGARCAWKFQTLHMPAPTRCARALRGFSTTNQRSSVGHVGHVGPGLLRNACSKIHRENGGEDLLDTRF